MNIPTKHMGSLLALVLAAAAWPRGTEAYPTRLVHDRLWSQSAPWIVVNNQAGLLRAIRQLRVTQSDPRCADPLNRADVGAAPLCLDEAPARSVWVHFIDAATGRESRDPIEFTEAVQTVDVALPVGQHLLFVHQGANARGAVTVRVDPISVRGFVLAPRYIPALAAGRNDFDLSGDVLLDVGGAPEDFDVEAPLQPDGPSRLDPVLGTPIAGFDGNLANDYLGVDATEVWAFDDNMRIITADRAQTGVAAAGALSSLTSIGANRTTARHVLVRPFVAGAPFTLRSSVEVGGGAIVEAAGATAMLPGRMRAILNPRRDTDGDRLGDRLEQELGLCNGASRIVTLPQWHDRPRICTLEVEARQPIVGQDQIRTAAADPRDSDADGLSDGAEVLGADNGFSRPRDALGGIQSDLTVPLSPTTDTQQTLPRWGFDPLHKDLLIEMDRLAPNTTSCMNATTGCTMDRSVLPGNFPGADGNLDTSMDELWRWRRAMARLPATRVANPDGRDGIEMHFDVRFPTVATRGHGMVPMFVGSHSLPGGRRATVGGNGLIIYLPNGGSGSQCSCNSLFSGPDPRHGGFALWFQSLSNPSGGQNTCDQAINASAALVSGDAMHEFGHVLGLHHGGPLRCLLSPFAPPSSLSETLLEHKVSYISHMSYAWGTGRAGGRYLNQLTADPYVEPILFDDIPTFSVGRLARFPIPRFVLRADGNGEQVASPELDPWGGADTSVVPQHTLSLAPLANGSGANTHIDFNRNGRADATPFERSVTPGASAYVGLGRPLQNYTDYYCAREDVFRSAPGSCCASGTWNAATSQCQNAAGTAITSNTPVAIEAHTMLVTGPAVPVATSETFWNLFVDDVDPAARNCTAAQVATPASPCFNRPFRAQGRLRAVSTHDYVVPEGDTYPYCTEARDACHREVPGTPGGRDVTIDGAAVLFSAPSVIAAATATVAGAGESTMIAYSQRTAMECVGSIGLPVDCPWGAMTVAVGPAATARFARFGAFRRLTVSNAPARVGGVAVVAMNPEDSMRPTAFTLLVRDGSTNGLWWSTCSATVCQPMREVLLDGGTFAVQATANGPIAAAVQRVAGQQPRLGMLLTERDPNPPNNLVIRFGRLRFNGGALAIGTVAVKQGVDFVGTVAESAKSLAFRSDGAAVLSFENNRFEPALAEIPFDPFSSTTSELQILNPQSDGGSRVAWRSFIATTGPSAPRWAAYMPSPGVVWGLAVDARAPTTVVPDDQPDLPSSDRAERVVQLRSLLASSNGIIRGARPYAGPQSILLQLSARLDMMPAVPHHDFDDAATMAFGVCQVLFNSTRGVRGGDLQPRPGLAPGQPDSRIRCPGAADWGANSSIVLNQAVGRFRLPRPTANGAWSNSEMLRAVVDLVSGPSWYGATPRESTMRPAALIPPDPQQVGCSVGVGPSESWRRLSLSAAETTGSP